MATLPLTLTAIGQLTTQFNFSPAWDALNDATKTQYINTANSWFASFDWEQNPFNNDDAFEAVEAIYFQALNQLADTDGNVSILEDLVPAIERFLRKKVGGSITYERKGKAITTSSGTGNGLTTAQVDARIANWAEQSNPDAIPASKLTNAIDAQARSDASAASTAVAIALATKLNESQVDARVEAGVEDWAETGNTDAIPAGKLTNAGGAATDQVARDAAAAARQAATVAQTTATTAQTTADTKLNQVQVDNRVQAGVEDWAEEGNTDAIPADKLTNAAAGAASASPTGDLKEYIDNADINDRQQAATRVSTEIGIHNESSQAHPDIRRSIQAHTRTPLPPVNFSHWPVISVINTSHANIAESSFTQAAAGGRSADDVLDLRTVYRFTKGEKRIRKIIQGRPAGTSAAFEDQTEGSNLIHDFADRMIGISGAQGLAGIKWWTNRTTTTSWSTTNPDFTALVDLTKRELTTPLPFSLEITTEQRYVGVVGTDALRAATIFDRNFPAPSSSTPAPFGATRYRIWAPSTEAVALRALVAAGLSGGETLHYHDVDNTDILLGITGIITTGVATDANNQLLRFFNVTVPTTTAYKIPASDSPIEIVRHGTTATTTAETPLETIAIACSDETSNLTASTSVPKVTFRLPYNFGLTKVKASLTTASVGAELIVDIKDDNRTIFNTFLRVDANEKTSETATTTYALLGYAAVATTNTRGIAADSEMTIFVRQIGSTTAGAGLKVYLIGRQL